MLVAMIVRAGTSGFSYKEWRGSFYPEKLPEKQMLSHYASLLPTVELNNTFYRMPKESAVNAWVREVPDDFRFVVKASRRISHISRLNNVEEPVRYLKEMLAHFGSKLGAVLVQLPPNFKHNPERLHSFLKLWGRDFPLALEFRHASWFASDVLALLKEHGAALCVSDIPEHGPLDSSEVSDIGEMLKTASLAYLRLRQEEYDAEALGNWKRTLQAASVEQAYVFFKHEVLGPHYAQRFNEL